MDSSSPACHELFNSDIIIDYYEMLQIEYFRWFERATMTVILVNCVTLGMYQPCIDTTVCDQKCQMLKVWVVSDNEVLSNVYRS